MDKIYETTVFKDISCKSMKDKGPGGWEMNEEIPIVPQLTDWTEFLGCGVQKRKPSRAQEFPCIMEMESLVQGGF